jgi:uncharacterized protein
MKYLNKTAIKSRHAAIRVLSILLLLTIALTGFAQQYPERPSPPRLVNDMAGMLSSSEAQALEQKLVAYDDSTSTQITIVTLHTLDGIDISQYAAELGEKWGVGRKQKDNGVLLLVALDDRKVFIATGRGVEQYLPDAICKRIVEQIIKPSFKQSDYYGGLNAAVDNMIARLSGTFEGEDDGGQLKIPPRAIITFIILIIIVIIFISRSGGGGGRGTYSRRGYYGGPFIGGGFGGFGGGGGGSSGGGGGFGGFGGGSFGGGGSGGSW